MKATVLVQTDTPARSAELLDVLETYGQATLVTGAYDAIVEISGGPDETGRTVLAIQALDGVDRTLTLPHIDPEALR